MESGRHGTPTNHLKAERVSVVLGGFRTCGDRRGQVSEIGWQYPPAHPPALQLISPSTSTSTFIGHRRMTEED